MKKVLFISLALILAIATVNLDARKVKFKNGDVYDGEWKSKAPNGMGVMIYANGEIYSGYWVNGIKEGLGTMTFLNGDEYLGNWKEDKLCGEGKMTFANKDYYEGFWEDNKQHGEGKMDYADGSTYVGGWAAGLYEGSGKRVYPNKDEYEGSWEAGLQQGEGTMLYATGASYKGFWNKGLPSGDGVMNYADGDVYSGKWQNGKKFGEGELYDKAHDRFISGIWNDSDLSGNGSIRFVKDSFETLALNGEWLGGDAFSTSFSLGNKTYAGTVAPFSGDGETGPCLLNGKVSWDNGTLADGKWNENITLANCVYTDMTDGKVRYNMDGRSYDGDIKEGKENNGSLTISIPAKFSFSGELRNGEPFGIYVGDFKACPMSGFDLSAWDEVQGSDIGRIDGIGALSGVFKKDIFTFKGLLKDGVPEGETYMEIGRADSLSVNSFWKEGKVVSGKGIYEEVPFTLTGSEESNSVQVDLETGERCVFIYNDPMSVLMELKIKIQEHRLIREKLAAEMMAASQQPVEPVQAPASEPAPEPVANPAPAL